MVFECKMRSSEIELISGVSDSPPFQGGFQLLVSIDDEDDINSDDHVDDLYVERNISPGGSIAEVSDDVIITSPFRIEYRTSHCTHSIHVRIQNLLQNSCALFSCRSPVLELSPHSLFCRHGIVGRC